MSEVAKTKRTDIMLVDPRNIVVKDGFNVRQDMGDIEALAKSIVETGLQVPLKAVKVRGEDKFELVDGHRRLKAILHAIENGLADIKYVEVSPFKGNAEDRVLSMVITGTGQKPLNEIEQAEAIKRLTNFGYVAEEIATKIGKSVPQVYNLLTLSGVAKKIKDKIHKGLISGGTVVQIVREVKDEDEQLKVVEEAIEDAEKQSEKTGKKKKATAKNVKSLTKKSPVQKLKETLSALEDEGVENDKVSLLKTLNEKLKTASVEELVELFK
jgi:ParB family chromosome partitioning protein